MLKFLLSVYITGFLVTITFHAVFLQMVTLELALLRSFVWPVYLATGWPHGTPLPMD